MGRLDLPDRQRDENATPAPFRYRPGADLSYRELQVLAQLATGDTNTEIAATLRLSVETVKEHVKHVLEKFDAHNRAHAVAIGFRRGLIT